MKKLIAGIVIGLALTTGVAYASMKYLAPQEVATQQIFSDILNTNHIVVYKIVDGNTTCYINPADNNGYRTSSSISCVK